MAKLIKHNPPLVIGFAVALALLLVWPAWVAVRNGLSDLYARPAIDYLEEKRPDDYRISEDEWQAIATIVTQADEMMPDHPRYLEALGLLHQLKATKFDHELSSEEMDIHAAAAMDYYRRAVAIRPTWPYYWGNLALEHYRLGDYATAEYSLALANASRFGPWRNDSQRLVIDLGSETWDFLSPGAKREFIMSVERGLDRQPQETIRTLLGYGTWPKLCASGEASPGLALPHIEALCTDERFAGYRYPAAISRGD